MMQAFGADTIDWLNFSVFLNAWNLISHEVVQPNVDGSVPCTWLIVNSLLNKCIMEKVQSMESLIRTPQSGLQSLVPLVTEPLAWHTLVMQSFVRAYHPSGKKKKKSGSSDHSQLSHMIRDSLQSTCNLLEEVTKWLKHHINRAEDENLDIILSTVRTNGQDEEPGRIFKILETSSASINEAELGIGVCQAMKSWSPVDVARKIITGHQKVLSKLLRICESKVKCLQKLQQQLAQA